MALMISGAARLTAHGSAAAVAVGAAIVGKGIVGGRAVAVAGDVTVGSGVVDAVESLEPHAATASAAAPITTAHFTEADRTVIAIAGRTGARPGIASPAIRLRSR
jgi:hypothetical protein